LFNAHGAELLASLKSETSDDYVILVKWRNEYVVARIASLEAEEWYWGNYFPTTDDGWNRAFGRFMHRAGKPIQPDM
jgi:hypothetical protein